MDSLWKSIVNLGNKQLDKMQAKEEELRQKQWTQNRLFWDHVRQGNAKSAVAMIEAKKIDKQQVSCEFLNCVAAGDIKMAKALMPYSQKNHQEEAFVQTVSNSSIAQHIEMLSMLGQIPTLKLKAVQDAVLIAALKKDWAVVDCLFKLKKRPLNNIGWTAQHIKDIFSKPLKRLGRKLDVSREPMRYLASKSLLDSRQDVIDLIAPFLSELDKIYALQRIDKCTSKNNEYPVIAEQCLKVFAQGKASSKYKNDLLQSFMAYGQENLVNTVLDTFPKHRFDIERWVALQAKMSTWSVDTQQKLVEALDTGNILTVLLQSMSCDNHQIFSMALARMNEVPTGGNAVVMAARMNKVSYLQELLGAGITIKPQHYNDALQWASENENPAMLELLYPHADVERCLGELKHAALHDRQPPRNYGLLQAKIDGIDLHEQIKSSYDAGQVRTRKM